MRRLSLAQILLYSSANLGANLVYALANFGFPLFLRAYAVPNVLVGFLAQERSFVGGFVQPVVGAISDRLPPNRLGKRRPFFLIGVPLTAVALVFLSTHPPMWAVIAVMTVFSFFLAVAYDPYVALMADIAPPEQRGRIGGAMAVFNMAGQITVIGLAFLLWEEHQQTLFWLIAVGLVLSFGVTFFGIQEPPIIPRHGAAETGPTERFPGNHEDTKTPGEQGTENRERGAEARSLFPFPYSLSSWFRAFVVGCQTAPENVGAYISDLLAHREVVKYLAATFFFWLGNGGIAPFITRFGVDLLGARENESFWLVLPAILGTALFAVPAGLLTERYGKKPVLNVGMLGFGAIALVGGLTVSTVPQGLAMMSMVGVFNAITTALILPLLADLIPRNRAGEFMGVGAMTWSISQTLGALGAGAMADLMGTLRWSFALGGLFMLVGFALMLTVRAPRPSQTEMPVCSSRWTD